MSAWPYIFGTVTILGALITVVAFINGKATRKVILQLGELLKEEIKSTRELIAKESESTRELIAAEAKNARELIKELKSK